MTSIAEAGEPTGVPGSTRVGVPPESGRQRIVKALWISIWLFYL
ncbi:hypothetical protein [Streptomyces sp. H34-S4]|nr:hypothetical protein [Streptomyces sp. H34-S4]MCY0936966.1 hypothetical protein [Streptomyces sp. H34-S4]